MFLQIVLAERFSIIKASIINTSDFNRKSGRKIIIQGGFIMNKTPKKTLALLFIVALTLSVLSACKPKPTAVPDSSAISSASASEVVRDPITMKVMVSSSDFPDTSAKTEIGKLIKEKFNIEFEYVLAPTNYDEQCSIWLSGGDYPEVMRLTSNTLLQQYIDANAVVCLEEYLEKMPNFKEKRAEQIPYWRSHALDGKLYKWENASPESPEGQRDDFDVIVRTDLLEQQNWPDLVTTSDYISFLKKALAQNPTTNDKNTIGLTFPGAETYGVTIPYIMMEKGDRYFHMNMVVVGDVKANKFVNKWSIPESKESIKFFNDLYQEGLLDKESYSLKNADCLAKMTTAQPAINFYTRWNAGSANAGLIKAGLDKYQYIELPIQLDSQKGQKRQQVQNLVRPYETLIMTKNCKNPERFFELLDWWQTDEAQLIGGSGFEGVDYEVKDGKRVPLAPLSEYLKGTDLSWTTKIGTYESGLFASCLGYRADNYEIDGQPYRITKDPAVRSTYGLTDRQREAYTALGWKNFKSWYEENGEIHYDALMKGIAIDPASDMGKDSIKITEIVTQYSSKLVFAKNDAEFDAIYEEMLKNVSAYNPDKITEAYNTLLETAKAKIK